MIMEHESKVIWQRDEKNIVKEFKFKKDYAISLPLIKTTLFILTRALHEKHSKFQRNCSY